MIEKNTELETVAWTPPCEISEQSLGSNHGLTLLPADVAAALDLKSEEEEASNSLGLFRSLIDLTSVLARLSRS